MSKQILWNTVGSVFYSACQWIITIFVVHIASYEMAGYLSLAMTTSSSFSAIALCSMRNFQVSDVTGEYSSGQYVTSRFLTCGAAFLVCILAGFGNSPYQLFCIMAFMLIRVSEALVDVMHGINQKYERYDLIGISYILRGLITVIAFSVGLAITQNMVLTLFLVAVLTLFTAVCFDLLQTYRLERFRLNFTDKQVVVLLLQCAPLVVFTFLLSMENLVPKMVLQALYDTETLGVYSTIASPTLVIQVCASVIFNPLIPRLSLKFHEGRIEELRKALHKIYGMLLLMCVIVVIGAVLLGRWGLTVLFGSDILANYDLFLPIVVCTLCTGIVWIQSAIVILLRKMKALLAGIVIDFAICALVSVPMIRSLGANGVSYVQILVLLLFIIYMMVVCEHTIKKESAGHE